MPQNRNSWVLVCKASPKAKPYKEIYISPFSSLQMVRIIISFHFLHQVNIYISLQSIKIIMYQCKWHNLIEKVCANLFEKRKPAYT